MPRIANIYTQPFSLAMNGVLHWGKHSSLNKLEHVLITVTSDSWHHGHAEAPVRPTIYGETQASIRSIIQDYLAPRLIGLELDDVGAIDAALSSVANNQAALAALDIAIHEARALSQGTSLFEAWRGPQEQIHVSYILGIGNLEVIEAEAKTIFEQGVRVFKIKIGRDLKQDKALIKALHHTFEGEAVTLYADANESLDVGNVEVILEELAALGLAYVEEPLPKQLIKARAALKLEGIVPIVADDSCFSLADLERELDFDTFDILNIKTARTGFSESDQLLQMANEAGKAVMVGSQACSSLGSRQAAIFASRAGVSHPCELSFPLKLNEDSLRESLRFKDGVLELSTLTKAELADGLRR